MENKALAEANINPTTQDLSGLYVVYDKVAQDSGPIFQASNVGVAIRQYKQLMASQSLNKQDFDLICLGYFDRISMELIPELIIQLIPEE